MEFLLIAIAVVLIVVAHSNWAKGMVGESQLDKIEDPSLKRLAYWACRIGWWITYAILYFFLGLGLLVVVMNFIKH